MKRVPAVIVWAVAFAFVESAVVEYLRAIYYPLNKGGFQFPILTVEQLESFGTEHWNRLLIELGRELATLVMLATLGIAAGQNRREAWAHFMMAFGVWDLAFYFWLKVLLDWPTGLMTWDLLFLLPVPWVSPVLAPVVVSIAMIVAGLIVLRCEARGKTLVAGWKEWAAIVVGGAVVIVSFCWDYRNIMQGGLPNPFNWPLFVLGLGISSAAFFLVLIRHRGK